jgi:hypothetical protein
MAGAIGGDYSLEEEEVSTGDMLDMLTPREVSKTRYRYHHEWMEEIFSSPYRTNQIVPVELGLGRKGELESLTRGFFDAPMGPSSHKESKDDITPEPVGKMDPEKAEEFADSVARRVAEMTAEIEKLKKKHAKRLGKIKRTSTLKEAELKLRDAVVDPDDLGSEFWRVEGRLEAYGEDGMSSIDYGEQKPKIKVDDVVHELESAWGKSIVPISDVTCRQKGGLLNATDTAANSILDFKSSNGEDLSEGDVNMGNTDSSSVGRAVAPVDSTPERGAAPATEPPVSQAGPETSGGPSMTVETNGSAPRASATDLSTTNYPPDSSISKAGRDVEMTGVYHGYQPSAEGEGGDWVLVDKDEKPSKDDPFTKSDKLGSGENSGTAGIGTPGSGLQGLTPGGNTDAGESGLLETSNFDDAAGFSHIDSAGDALAVYSEQNDGLDLGDLDNSAFGDAFHTSEGEHEHHDTDDIS